MAYRTVTAPDGREWEAWDTVPSQEHGTVRPALADGWLTFRTTGEKRRLAPIPAGWAEAPDERLLAWLDQADPASDGSPAAE